MPVERTEVVSSSGARVAPVGRCASRRPPFTGIRELRPRSGVSRGMRAIACALGALIACAPSGEEQPVAVRSDEPEPVCGALAIATSGDWRTDHPLLAPLAAGWHPRAENGWPIAVRDAVAPWTFPDHEFVQVKVGGIPRDR